MKFEQMNLDKNIIQALHTLGYEKPLPVQEQVIPNILSGKDCIVKSRTGSGKTASFAIPIIQNLEIDERSPQALVLTPTRELALQIQQDFDRIGFQWVDCGDQDASVLSFLRRDGEGRTLLCVANFTPVPRTDYRIGVPETGVWTEVLNSDAMSYGGGGWGNAGQATATDEPCHGYGCSVGLTLPALSLLIFRHIQ